MASDHDALKKRRARLLSEQPTTFQWYPSKRMWPLFGVEGVPNRLSPLQVPQRQHKQVSILLPIRSCPQPDDNAHWNCALNDTFKINNSSATGTH